MVSDCIKESTIKDQVQTNKDEFDADGYIVLVKDELSFLKNLSQLKTRAKSLALFAQRTILRIGRFANSKRVKNRRYKLYYIFSIVEVNKFNK